MDGLCEYEIAVLEMLSGIPHPELTWGAAMSVALESLCRRGLADCTGGCYGATADGRALLGVEVSANA